MRPLRLEVEGLTSFAARASIDFRELQLFAITGPTGAGKSSLIDAMLLALFGKVPRVGREHGQLISHGHDQLDVLLEFQAGGARYRVARRIKRKGAAEARLDKLRPDGSAESLAGKARDVEAAITGILGIDYDAFTRSVVLPQGQFDQFLKGDRKDRRGILVELLGLGLYERMAKLAGERQRDLQATAAAAAQRLERDFAAATPAALQQLDAELAAAEQALQQLAARQQALAAAERCAQALRQARQQARQQADELQQLQRQHAEAAAAAQRLQQAGAAFAGDRAALQQQLQAAAHDPARSLLLAGVLPLLAQLQQQAASVPALATAAERAAATAARAEAELQRATAALPQLQAAVEERQADGEAAEREFEQRQLAEAALHLRGQLHDGDVCPVCEQAVARVPAAPPTTLAAARRARDRARADLQAAERLRDDTERAQRQRQKELPLLHEAAQRTAAQQAEGAAQIDRLLAELAAAGVRADAASAETLRQQLGGELQQLQQRQEQHALLAAKLQQLEQGHGQHQQQLAAAAARLELLADKLRQQETAAQAAAAALAAAEGAFADATAPLDLPAARAGGDELQRLQQLAQQAQAEQQAHSRRLGQLGQQRQQLQQAITAAAALRAESEQLAADAALAKSLALMLHGDQFQDFVQEAALRLLCEDGARHLLALSQGRYELRLDGGDFAVVDHWNADRERSVKTLSGGETFLASLSLALALAERIVGIAAPTGGGALLECLFVDEGFGALDAEALEAAVTALETLQGGNRMVGVVTHLQPLAERLPARLEVRSEAGKARVVVA